jgi:amino acid adenylation domain-containing protein
LAELVGALEHAPQTSIGAIDVLPEQEKRLQLVQWNATQAEYPSERCIHELFEEQARRNPGARAVQYEDQSLSYGQLNERADRLAHYLRSHGVGPDTRVGICMERSLEMVVGLLGILKAGGAYVPLDPSYPAERLAYMLADAQPKVLLIQEALRAAIAGTTAQVVALDSRWGEIANGAASRVDARDAGLCSEHAAYVIYTSGSSGKPKGVVVEHRNVVRLFAATQREFSFDERDVWTMFHSFAFDFSVWELWGALLHGGRVVVVPALTARSPQAFYRLVCAEGVTVLNQTPSAFAGMIEAQRKEEKAAHRLRVVIFGGEALEARRLQPWVERHGVDSPQLVNMYGITETTVHVTYRRVNRQQVEEGGSNLIGRPIGDLRVYLLDRYGRPVPIGVVGEMYVGGAGVARGYLNRPALTAERFVRDPFSADQQARLYRTGDLGRWRADGELEYLGRNDDQVKIRGYRIELGEIEARLSAHPQVREAAVLAREHVTGEKRLTAYVVARASAESRTPAPSAQELRTHMLAGLPEYMVPAAYVFLDRLPLTTNGKLDRRALPAAEPGAVAKGDYVPPHNEVQRALCELWSEILDLPRVGIDDNFFALGGDSIVVLRLVGRAQAMAIEFTVADLFRYPTVAELSAAIAAKQAGEPERVSVGPFELLSAAERAELLGRGEGIVDAYPLSELQLGMYFHSELAPDSAVYHDVFSWQIETRFRREPFERAICAVVQRHPLLRTAFVMSSERRLVQVVHQEATVAVVVEELSGLAAAEQHVRIHACIEREKYRRFIWSVAPLLRVFVYVLGASRFQFVLSFHHAILDGWSVASLQTELLNRYVHFMEGRALELTEPAALYRDYIARERQALQSARSQEYWRELLQGAPRTAVPVLQSEHGAHRGAAVASHRVIFEEGLSQRLDASARQLGVGVRLLLLAAHVKVLSVVCAEDDVLTGVVSHGRLEREGGDQVLGLHLNTLPIRVEVGEGSWRALALRLQELETSMQPHRHYPHAAIQRLVGRESLVDTLFNFVRFHVYRQVSEGVKVLKGEGFEQTNFKFAANFVQHPFATDIEMSIAFDPAVYPCSQIERIGGYYRRALEMLAWDIDACHNTCSLLGEAERNQLLVEWNRTAAPYPADRCIHELFEEQARRTPDAVAVVHEDQAITYEELNGRANTLAHYLKDRGAGPERRVGLCVERGVGMIVGILGILKAGAAYVPLEPSYPPSRLEYLCADSGVEWVVTSAGVHAEWMQAGMQQVCLEETGSREPGARGDLRVSMSAQNLAYVIYTSGSTGRPKGVRVTHHNAANLSSSMQGTPGISCEDRLLGLTTLSFDIALLELCVPLMAGGTVIVASRAAALNAERIKDLMRDQLVTLLQGTPATWRLLLESGWPGDPKLKALIGGESFPLEFSAKLAPRVKELWNMYGPSETTVWSTLHRISRADRSVYIGKPIGNTCAYVLERAGQLSPVGVPGELCIGGAGVSPGYLRRGGSTAERFVPDSFGRVPGQILYRTGDLARWLPDGNLEFLGRADHQVKVRGHRIELGEIEAQLLTHPQVRAAVVLAREDHPGEKRLVAYYIASDEMSCGEDSEGEGGAAGAEGLRAYLRERLPEYMVPVACVRMQAFPLTPNGKLDRRALPAPDLDAFARVEYEAPQGETEETVAQIWAELLRVERVGRQDNFFELGGHSLLAMQLVSRVRQAFSVEVELRSVYDYSSMRAFSVYVDRLVDLDRMDEGRLESMTEEEAEQLLGELSAPRI